MQSIPSSVNQSPQSPADAVASIGLDETFIELLIRPLGATFELRTDLVQYSSTTGQYLREEVARSIADDADDAIEAATDLEWSAYAKLTERDVIGGYKSPCGFPEAIERLFAAGYGARHAVAAE